MRSSSYKLTNLCTNQKKEKFANCDLDVTHDQAFNWTKTKASNTSTTPPLKVTMFLCFQTSLTTAIQITPQTLFTERGALLILNLNWEKFNNGTLWNTLSARPNMHNNVSTITKQICASLLLDPTKTTRGTLQLWSRAFPG